MACYMDYDGVEGAVTAAGYEGQVALEGVEFSIERDVEQIVGDMQNRAKNLPVVEKVKCTKQGDQSSYALIQEAVMGKGKNCTISIVEPGDTPTEFLRYELKDCIISSYSQSSDGDQPSEEFEISFSFLTYVYTAHDSGGNAATVGRISYDMQTGKKS